MNTATTARVKQPKPTTGKRTLVYTGQKSMAELNLARVVHSTDIELMHKLTDTKKDKQW